MKVYIFLLINLTNFYRSKRCRNYKDLISKYFMITSLIIWIQYEADNSASMN